MCRRRPVVFACLPRRRCLRGETDQGRNLYDVLIVGAGPAGNVAARGLASRGYSVGVVDYRAAVGDKLCTGIIGMECAERFPVRQADVYYAANAAAVYSPAGRKYRLECSTPQALVVDRVSYVAGIARAASELGAQYHLGYCAREARRTRDGIVVTAHRNGSSERFEARLLMVSSGFRSALTDLSGLQNGHSHDYMLAFQTVVETSGLTETEVYVGDRIAPGSFGWLVPIAGSYALLGTISRKRSDGHLTELRRSLERQGRVLRTVLPIRGWGVPLRPMSKTYADRVLVLGDAAGLLKPTTGGGIYYAMLSGEIAASTADRALRRGALTEESLKPYEVGWKSEFAREMNIGYYARLLYESMDDAQREALLEVFLSQEFQAKLVNAPDFSFDRHSWTILRTIGNRRILKILGGFGRPIGQLLAQVVRSAVFGQSA